MRFLFFLAATLVSLSLSAQDSTSTKISIEGRAVEKGGLYLANLLIINERTYTGTFGNSDGTYSVEVLKNDTLVFGAIGYNSVKVCYADSAYKPVYNLPITLRKLSVNLAEAEIIAPRDLQDIQKDIERLGYEEKDYRISGANALESPITFLYEMLSRKERSKRLVIKMENDDLRRELLKELFVKYVDYDIIDLAPEDFDEFVDFLNISDEFLKSSAQYEFIQFVRVRFYHFQTLRKTRKLEETDYNYHED